MVIYDEITIGGSTVTDFFNMNVRKSISSNNMSSTFEAELNNFDGKNSSSYNVGDEVVIYADKDNLIMSSATPIAHYKMNDNLATTNVIDSAGSNDGTLIGGDNTSDISVTGKINNALDLDGTNDYISMDNSGIAGPWTVACWVKTTDTIGQFYIERGDGVADTSGGFRFGMGATGKPSVTTYGKKDYASANTAVNDGNWHHVAAVFNSSFDVTYYLDGVADGGDTHNADMASSAEDGLIGASYPAVSYPTPTVDYDGIIDDVRIYNSALTAVDISSIYNLGNGTEVQDLASDNTKIFSGILENIRFPSKALDEDVLLSGRDFTARMMDRTVEPEVYTTLPAGSIVKDIISKYTDDITTTNVDDSPTTISRIAFNHTPVYDAVRKLAELSNFVFYVDEDKDLHFNAESSTSSGKTFDSGNVVKADFKDRRDTVFNEIWVYGDRYLDGFKEEFTGDGTGSVFTLTHRPHNTNINVGSPTELSTKQTGGIFGMGAIPISGTDYLVDFFDKQIIFVSGTTLDYSSIPANNALITVEYDRSLPIVKVGRNQDSIKAYGTRIKRIVDKDIKDPETAQERLIQEIDKAPIPAKQGVLDINGIVAVTPSQTCVVNLPNQNVSNKTYDILEASYNFNKKKNLAEDVLRIKVNKKITDVTDTIKDLINDVKQIQGEDIDTGDVITRFEFNTGSFGIRTSGLVLSTRTMGSSFLLGVPGPATNPQAGGILGSVVVSGINFLGANNVSAYTINFSGGYP